MIIPVGIKFKDPELLLEYQQISPTLRMILESMAKYVVAAGHSFIITDLLSEASEDKKLKRISKSHQEGRAADIRVRDWPLDFRQQFERHFEEKFKEEAAISLKTKKPNLIQIHDNGSGIHIHAQTRK
jgi:hypothetical protein